MKKLFSSYRCGFIALLAVVLFCTVQVDLQAQSKYHVFGFKGGLDLASQKWNTASRGVLLKPCGDLIYERYQPGGGMSFYTSLGYHLRGNGESFIFNNLNGDRNRRRVEMIHKNISANIGAKGRIVRDGGNALFYYFAARVEANIGNQFDIYESMEDAVNPIVAGATLGFGYEYLLGNNKTLLIGFSVQPDFTNQIYIQPQQFVDGNGNLRNFSEERIRNFSFELSIGMLLFKERYN